MRLTLNSSILAHYSLPNVSMHSEDSWDWIVYTWTNKRMWQLHCADQVLQCYFLRYTRVRMVNPICFYIHPTFRKLNNLDHFNSREKIFDTLIRSYFVCPTSAYPCLSLSCASDVLTYLTSILIWVRLSGIHFPRIKNIHSCWHII